MKKTFGLLALLSLFVIATSVSAQSPRLQCSNGALTIQMEAPSANAECLTVINNESAAQGKSLMEARVASATIVLNDLRKDGSFSPEVTVYSVSGLSSVNTEIYQKAVDLTNQINAAITGSGTAAFSAPIPFLPYQDKKQLLAALPEIIQLTNGTAVRFLTAYGDAGGQVSNSNLIYTLQGISQDGSKYLSVTLPLSNAQITGPVDVATFNWAALPPESWSPTLESLDAIMRTILLN